MIIQNSNTLHLVGSLRNGWPVKIAWLNKGSWQLPGLTQVQLSLEHSSMIIAWLNTAPRHMSSWIQLYENCSAKHRSMTVFRMNTRLNAVEVSHNTTGLATSSLLLLCRQVAVFSQDVASSRRPHVNAPLWLALYCHTRLPGTCC